MKTIFLLATLANLAFPSASDPLATMTARPDDASILRSFDNYVSADMGCAQLAAEKGHSKEVRDYARMLVEEHGVARQLIRDASLQLNVTLRPSDNPRQAEHDKVVKSLRERPDVAFDILFLRHEVEYHKELVELINKEWTPGAKSPDLSSLFAQAGPALEAHATKAQELWQKLRPDR
ncbi:MAG: DUF4142 domain-containing protein [Gemmatimonadaceae bacterium]|nr:DUF4142 domain-containing protein [Gemmatimonadaceae bacterium]